LNARTVSLIHREPPIRWPDIICALQYDAGLSLRQIGNGIGVSHNTVDAWRSRGSCPNYEDGRALLALLEAMRPHLREPLRIA